jgi:dGTPase
MAAPGTGSTDTIGTTGAGPARAVRRGLPGRPEPSGRSWLARRGTAVGGIHTPHADPGPSIEAASGTGRVERERAERERRGRGASGCEGAGRRARPEEPDPLRTCFERDRDRILHSKPFRRLAGKTQVVAWPPDHVRTRLTHALEVAQVARAVARALGLNEALAEAIALGHDCGHGPGGHASEEALSSWLPGGYDHAVAGADVALAELNLCEETLDGIRNHSWSRPAPTTPEGCVVSLADRIAYCCHDFADACEMRMVEPEDLPAIVARRLGRSRREQIGALVADAVEVGRQVGRIGLTEPVGEALEAFREYNYERIYTSELARQQRRAVIAMLGALVERFVAEPALMGGTGEGRNGGPVEPGSDEAVRVAVAYVAGMTDRYAAETAVRVCGWDPSALPPRVV